MSNNRENWGSKLGLILAMAGNAIGLGNFWRYPYLAASNGGGAFMIPYIAAIIILGIPILMVEWNLGRYGGKYGHATIGPMIYLQAREVIKPKYAIIIGSICGMFAFMVTILINSYYNHIIGWTLGYSYLSVTGKYMNKAVSTGKVFTDYIQSPGLEITFWIIALALLGLAVTRGIQQGIETWSKIMMPVLYIFGIILAIRSLTVGSPVRPDWSAIKGLNYLWNPDWSKLSWQTALKAAGQVFYTLSLGMGIIENYASYLKADDDIVLSGITTASLNEFAEVILGGTIVIPIAYAFLGPEGLGAGVGLSFISLPNIFRNMGGGQFFGTLWFLLLFFAGFTSAIAMYNYLTALLEEDLGVKRKVAAFVVFMLYVISGLPVGLEPILTKTTNLAYLTELDNWVGSYLILIFGLLEVIVGAWLFGKYWLDETNRGAYWKVKPWFFNIFVKVVSPLMLLILIVFSTRDYIKQGYFKWIPGFLEKTPQLVSWVQSARIVIILVGIIGFIESYLSIKKKYGKEITSGEKLII
ncbi:Na+-dependent transporter, SNF family [Caldanaerobius fijiensis DSM 17918]|uniref:Na+-dependent transporter, SNF family n=1 Tax=Caldanaerobius fijiensis DSM 17918 TaxID=1121256 RepID=A0A1M4SNE6_9THEO|nr:sodium-dependent transporter [Caldanaerobius fijiensis]SHE33716.1 Na+-dependent transporter, SNF family [Caldanaerobius fijiensis DSM 17918]